MTCRAHDWKPELLHTGSDGVPFAIDYVCRKCGKWGSSQYVAAVWHAHIEDVVERSRWDAALNAPAATV